MIQRPNITSDGIRLLTRWPRN